MTRYVGWNYMWLSREGWRGTGCAFQAVGNDCEAMRHRYWYVSILSKATAARQVIRINEVRYSLSHESKESCLISNVIIGKVIERERRLQDGEDRAEGGDAKAEMMMELQGLFWLKAATL